MSEIRYLISEDNELHNHAGSKARNDVEEFLDKPNIKMLKVSKFFNSQGVFNKVKITNTMTIEWIKIISKIKKGSEVIIQYPLESPKDLVNFFIKLAKKVKHIKFISIIHDLESLRFDTKRKFEEIKYLNEFKYIIVHNEKMKEYLISLGIEESKFIVLEVFDYKVNQINTVRRELRNEVAIAGNLKDTKSKYVYKLNNIKNTIKFNLFGPNYNGNISKNIKYFGQFPPEEIPKVLEGSFGLVWDGNDIETCTGITGKYLKYNNPHKLSLYIIAQLPIIIWKEAAMAQFVEDEKIGITINSLDEIESRINTLTSDDYENMLNNIEKISHRLKEGYYINKAIKESFK